MMVHMYRVYWDEQPPVLPISTAQKARVTWEMTSTLPTQVLRDTIERYTQSHLPHEDTDDITNSH